MINRQLISPKSIVVVGGSDDTLKPGGNTLKNLLDTHYSGDLFVVNPKADSAQGVKSYRNIGDIPEVECAILAIPAKMCLEAVETLCYKKSCKAIIILSAGFHEDSPEGAEIEKKIAQVCNETGTSLIGPNCIGVMTPDYAGVFTHPIPRLTPQGAALISGSGATIVFILEAAMQLGLTFSQVFSVGNCAQIGVEEALEYMDESYEPGKSSPVIMLYIENISDPWKLYRHASSLIRKGAKIAAIKSGYSEAGSRAASSHTGAMASPDKAVDALFRKAGIIRCYSRGELVNVASALMYPAPKGNRFAIVTHAGGPAVMQTDILSGNGIEIPTFSGPKADELLSKLYPGSSVANPIDFLATGTAAQLGHILDACENDFDVDGITVIFGNPGLTTTFDVYDLLTEKIKSSKKPIYPVLPSIVNSAEEIRKFQGDGGISFPDEVALGGAIVKIVNQPAAIEDSTLPQVDIQTIRGVIDSASNGYLEPEKVQILLDAAGIPRAKEVVAATEEEALQGARTVGYPLVMKVIGPIHKSDVGGVALNISDDETLLAEFRRMIQIPQTTAILMQPMLSGTQIFIGAKREGVFGHLVLCGLGGIFVETLKDISYSLAPVSQIEADEMIRGLRSYKMLEGTRGQEGVNITMFAEAIRRVSALCDAAPEIFEMDLNPLLGNSREVVAVDARIRIEK
ncbi:MAG: acetate--CoA ligase family protein [Bacteroidales bacterium]|nr:acetate--CoA ligase family protein [Bacteroidales bacterium]MBO7764495.1 acetate--CoA ligase family protein [Bacteroidales bacterium]